jgi:leader peptidase (prepilin peptidase)/N-methyltransferase
VVTLDARVALTITILYSAVVGLAIGSFLNVVIYRVPRSLSVIRPRSSCPGCHEFIASRDNVPVLSWLLLRGRCRHCRTAISPRYPLVELSTALLFAATAWRLGPHWSLVAFFVANAGLLALAAIDLEHLLLPRALIYATLGPVAAWLILTAGTTHQWHRLALAVACSLVWGVTFFVLNFVAPKALGFGDVRLAYLLGLLLGWLSPSSVLLGFFLANLIGAVVGVLLIVTGKLSRKQAVPYGVFLFCGYLVTFLFGRGLLSLFPHLTFN